jgi:hypothetical protein
MKSKYGGLKECSKSIKDPTYPTGDVQIYFKVKPDYFETHEDEKLKVGNNEISFTPGIKEIIIQKFLFENNRTKKEKDKYVYIYIKKGHEENCIKVDAVDYHSLIRKLFLYSHEFLAPEKILIQRYDNKESVQREYGERFFEARNRYFEKLKERRLKERHLKNL